MKTQQITLIGLRRLGASIGLAIKQSSLDVTIVGHDSQIALARQAAGLGAIDKVQRNLPRAAETADILVLAVSVSELEATLKIVGDVVQGHTLILDLSGWKGAGLKWAKAYLQRGHYVGAALVFAATKLSDGRIGVEAADADLFRDSVICLMPSPDAEPRVVETAVNFGHILGAKPYFVDTLEYDGLVQGLETVPGLLAAAMFRAVHKSRGWRDMLRFAGLPFAQSTHPLNAGVDVAHMAMGNKMATLRWLDALMEELKQMRRWIYEGEEEVLAAVLTELDLQREAWLRERAVNDWLEAKTPDLEQRGFAQLMFGGLAGSRDKS